MSSSATPLPGFEEPDRPDSPGPVETGLIKSLNHLQDGGWLTDAHAHIVALAKSTARKYDQLPAREKAYGYAQIVQSLTKVFEMLPQPSSGSDMRWNEWLETLLSDDETPSTNA